MAFEGQGINATVKGRKEFQKKMEDGNKKMSDGRRLHARLGTNIRTLVDRGFQTEGRAVTGKKWKKLSKATRFARRQGPGSGSPKILQDDGDLRRSFVMEFTDKLARVGTRLEYSEPHEFGGRKSYKIKAKNKPLLKFINSKGRWTSAKEVTHPPLPQRKMLPIKKISQKIVNKTTDNFVKDAYKKVLK